MENTSSICNTFYIPFSFKKFLSQQSLPHTKLILPPSNGHGPKFDQIDTEKYQSGHMTN